MTWAVFAHAHQAQCADEVSSPPSLVAAVSVTMADGEVGVYCYKTCLTLVSEVYCTAERRRVGCITRVL